jgi:hypothetical protein
MVGQVKIERKSESWKEKRIDGRAKIERNAESWRTGRRTQRRVENKERRARGRKGRDQEQKKKDIGAEAPVRGEKKMCTLVNFSKGPFGDEFLGHDIFVVQPEPRQICETDLRSDRGDVGGESRGRRRD